MASCHSGLSFSSPLVCTLTSSGTQARSVELTPSRTASQYNFAITDMYSGIITISANGLLVNQLLVAGERRFSTWRVDVTA
ncbi:hypothetical protein Vlu01_51730 [Micromonospora lutea]|uniref:Uncharacterized protein n=1 Tax=Micromonospora lutea TaxID=419825 RepID=A0ABQ4J314_9ACTN|nr:hypothetical protein Vlu01_51730 [Micromonospora lutea]